MCLQNAKKSKKYTDEFKNIIIDLYNLEKSLIKGEIFKIYNDSKSVMKFQRFIKN
jgi:hypothetical protein